MLKLTVSLILLLQTLTSSLQVHVFDADYQPQPGVNVHLDLYEFASDEDGTTATVVFSKECNTDTTGICTIEVGETTGMLRGRLDVQGYGGRDVIWPGGPLELAIRLDKVNPGTEAQPYDFQEKDGGVSLYRGIAWFPVTIVVLLIGGLVIAIYFRARQVHS